MNAVKDMHELVQQLDDLVDQSRAMLERAESGDWDKVIEQEKLINKLIMTFFSIPNVNDVPGVTSATKEILNINNKMQHLTAGAKNEINSKTDTIHKGRRAVDVYMKNAR